MEDILRECVISMSQEEILRRIPGFCDPGVEFTEDMAADRQKEDEFTQEPEDTAREDEQEGEKGDASNSSDGSDDVVFLTPVPNTQSYVESQSPSPAAKRSDLTPSSTPLSTNRPSTSKNRNGTGLASADTLLSKRVSSSTPTSNRSFNGAYESDRSQSPITQQCWPLPAPGSCPRNLDSGTPSGHLPENTPEGLSHLEFTPNHLKFATQQNSPASTISSRRKENYITVTPIRAISNSKKDETAMECSLLSNPSLVPAKDLVASVIRVSSGKKANKEERGCTASEGGTPKKGRVEDILQGYPPRVKKVNDFGAAEFSAALTRIGYRLPPFTPG